jgi:hypothetical protein
MSRRRRRRNLLMIQTKNSFSKDGGGGGRRGRGGLSFEKHVDRRYNVINLFKEFIYQCL